MATKMTREEAIKIVQSATVWTDEERDALAMLIPELAESEDEKIRKALIKLMTVAGDSYVMSATGFEKERLLAYLEMPKEQKPVPPLPPFDEMTPEDKMNHPLYLEGFDTGREVQKVFDEQKPAEWSEEDEDNLCRVIRVLEDNDSDWKELSNWLKSIRPSWKPSEDEERLINTSISFLKDFANKGYENAVECIDWLKSKLNGDSGK